MGNLNDGPVLYDTLDTACVSKEQEDDGKTRKRYRNDKIEFGRHVRLGPLARRWVCCRAKRRQHMKQTRGRFRSENGREDRYEGMLTVMIIGNCSQ